MSGWVFWHDLRNKKHHEWKNEFLSDDAHRMVSIIAWRYSIFDMHSVFLGVLLSSRYATFSSLNSLITFSVASFTASTLSTKSWASLKTSKHSDSERKSLKLIKVELGLSYCEFDFFLSSISFIRVLSLKLENYQEHSFCDCIYLSSSVMEIIYHPFKWACNSFLFKW